MRKRKRNRGWDLFHEAAIPHEERARREAEREKKQRQQVDKRLYREMAKLGLSREEVDEDLRRLEEMMR